MLGQTISHYKIVSKLGEGGMGVVYKAEDLKLPRSVALKFLPPHLSSDENAKKRFIHEAEAASALDHPNIGTIYEIDETPDGRIFIAMACYEGPTLKQMSGDGPLGMDKAIDIVSQIASGLAKAHESGILHRDVKPANVLLTTDGHAKIVDFGLAKLAGRTRVTRTGTTVGTVSHMSPEQARGGDVDSRSDVFSTGVVLYELLTGQLPFRGDHEAAVIYSIMNVDPEPLAAHREGLPKDAQRVIDKALAKDRDDRYASASDLLADLKKLQEGRQVAALEKRATEKAGLPPQSP
jgi:serine/threonine protein kinase